MYAGGGVHGASGDEATLHEFVGSPRRISRSLHVPALLISIYDKIAGSGIDVGLD